MDYVKDMVQGDSGPVDHNPRLLRSILSHMKPCEDKACTKFSSATNLDFIPIPHVTKKKSPNIALRLELRERIPLIADINCDTSSILKLMPFPNPKSAADW
ncbi:hypothetical protein RO3G_15872 [Rhizopus delemar RA 99-880]|uniref:Uncharacterized protein n=1 Tax=Rhizopus delemar (strain RA 99-880 / ATCC MYA-4621 / FGSC 9543 / NRRL 43880) TaxID=246409 RepID=I1CRT1_RHIO9|nr:hypothetical protein RO3G_15872 [Rhizopus delemar RA 99-880]|eukprot:EIE91161.1 hypothetical protein RO3G_15872 [Rhizopus delemar RA 99-880]